MKRRDFVRNTTLGAIGVPFVINELKYNTVNSSLFKTSKSAEDRVLVIIRLNGGNDGLNTVIPQDMYDNLAMQRSNIIIPETDILDLGVSNLGLHPTMTGMRNMFNDGKLSIIQNVGYPQQNRSHFKSMEIWSNGDISSNATTGWLGRYLDNEFPGFPGAYPDQENPDPFAMSMGYEVSATCQGLSSNFSMAVNNPASLGQLTSSIDNFENSIYGDHLQFISQIVDQSNAYATRVTAALNAGNSLSTLYPSNNYLAEQLQNIAKLISGGLQTKIYILNINGFDTHDAQIQQNDPLAGTHTNLLNTLSSAIEAFQDDLSLLGLENRVLGMTFSEFGRQIASNASNGTDHGDAAPMFLFGSCINNSVIGSNPIITDTIVNQAGVDMEFDFRNIYASILKDWFQADASDIQAMFEQPVSFTPLAAACNSSIGLDEYSLDKETLIVYPNPAVDLATVRFECLHEQVKLAIYDLNGRMLVEVFEKQINKGKHEVKLNLTGLTPGTYTVQVIKPSGILNARFIKR
jgi:uncharacterized protein (DUF1501 family)